nr:PREDICTED: uncharacterized protein LOC105671724 isoform X1 [Linepithema humile]
MRTMKEEQKILEVSAEKLRALEEGLQQKMSESKKKFEHKTGLCIRWIQSLHLILLLELMLFLAGSCYIIFQKYPSQVPEEKDTAIDLEKYISILDSMSEAQKSHPTTEMPKKLVKSGIIVDQLNNLLEDMGLIKEQESMQDKISATDIDSTMHAKSMPNSVGVENDNTMRASDFNNWPRIRLSLGDFKLNKEFIKNSVPLQFSSTKYVDDTIDKNAKIAQFLERLRDVAEIESKIEVDLKDFESKNDFTHNTNRLTSNSEENHGSDASNKLKNSNPEDSMDRRISADLINNLQNWKQKLSDLFADFFEDTTLDDRSEKSSFSDEINKQAINDLESGYVICPPDEPDESQESSAKGFSIFQSVSAQEISEQTENKSNENISASNEDKPNVDDSNVSMSASSDTSMFKRGGPFFLFSVLISSMENSESSHLPEIAANIKADEKRDSTENIKDSSEIWQDSAKHSTSNNDKFQWFNAPARFTDDLQPGPIDIPKLSDANIYPFLSEKPEYFEDLIPGSQCQVQIVRDIFVVRCPAVNFDEKWNLTSVETHTSDFPDVNSSEDFFYDFYDDASDQLEEQLTLQHNVPEKMDTVELQKDTPSVKILNVSPERVRLDFAGDPIQDDTAHILNEEEIRQVTTTVSPSSYKFNSDYVNSYDKFISWFKTLNSKQQEALKPQVHDILDYEHLETSAEISDLTASAMNSSNDRRKRMAVTELQNKLVSIFNNETKSLIDYVNSTKSLSSGNDYIDTIHNKSSNWTFLSLDSWRQQSDVAKKVVEDIRHDFFSKIIDNLSDSSNGRKKRMAVTEWQSVENTIEENNENVEVLQNLKKIFQRMEILAAYIDRLHERYLLHNKLDDDYVSSEFPTEIKKRRK